MGRNLAERLGFLYLDTGAMYRGITALALERGMDLANEAEITALARATEFSFPDLEQVREVNPPLHADGRDITEKLRRPEVEQAVSLVSRYRGVREALVAQQRRLAVSRSLVMVGRDIGSVVLPGAEVKIFLTATLEERARRRHEELVSAGHAASYADILEALRLRDERDATREISPLRIAGDATVVDSTGMTSSGAADAVWQAVTRRLQERGCAVKALGQDRS